VSLLFVSRMNRAILEFSPIRQRDQLGLADMPMSQVGAAASQ
jgi:hypothetical protein